MVIRFILFTPACGLCRSLPVPPGCRYGMGAADFGNVHCAVGMRIYGGDVYGGDACG